MALTVTNVKQGIAGDLRYKILTLAFDNSYPTGGEALAASSLGMNTIHHMDLSASAGYVFEYDHTNAKVIAYWVDTTTDGAPLAEVANTTDLSGLTAVRVIVWGV